MHRTPARTVLTLAALAATGAVVHAWVRQAVTARRARARAAREDLADRIGIRTGLEVVCPQSLKLTGAPQRVLLCQDADLYWGTVLLHPHTGALHVDVPGVSTPI